MQAPRLHCKICRSFLLEGMQSAKDVMIQEYFWKQLSVADMKALGLRYELRDDYMANTIRVHLQLASESEAWRPLRTVALT